MRDLRRVCSSRVVAVAALIVALRICICVCDAKVLQPNLLVTAEEHRIVVIGDVHGDADQFVAAMQLADLVTGDAYVVRWRASRRTSASSPMPSMQQTTLVQVGDLVDRGEQDVQCLLLALRLHEQVNDDTTTPDKVVLLLGNHEVMNMHGQFHYVHADSDGGFGSREVRAAALATHGPFGRALLDKCATLHVAERTLFVHAGGLTHALQQRLSVDEVNTQVRHALRHGDRQHALLGSRGPLWDRRTLFAAMRGECDAIAPLLRHFDVDRIVVGHTPQDDGHIGVYCDARVLAVDVGMSRWIYGHLAVLIIEVQRVRDWVSGQVHEMVVLTERATQSRAPQCLATSQTTYYAHGATRVPLCAVNAPLLLPPTTCAA